MDEKILIITNRSDYTADVVVKRLRERAVGFLRFNTEDFPLRTLVSVRIAGERTYLRLESDKWRMDQDDVKSVWYRRPVLPNLEGANLSENDRQFAVRESAEVTQSLWRLLRHKLWITQPDILRLVETKALQLKKAVELGFSVPDTLISNNSDEVRSFYRIHNGNVVVKPISHGGYGE